MKYVIAVASIASSVGAAAEPVLMLNEPRDVEMAKYSCGRAEEEIKSVKEGYKTLKCSDFEECQRASEINAACKVTGPVREVRGFHSQLLAQFASNPQCALTIMRLSAEKPVN